MINLLLGVIIGLLIPTVKCKCQKVAEVVKEKIIEYREKEGAQFIDPIPFKERYDNAEKIDDLIKKL